MRKLLALILSLIAGSPAIASGCYWIGRTAYCDANCWITHHWWDHTGTQWIRWFCLPGFLTDPAFIVAVVVLGVILATMLARAFSSSRLRRQTADAEAQATEAQAIRDKLTAAAAEADRFLETYRKR